VRAAATLAKLTSEHQMNNLTRSTASTLSIALGLGALLAPAADAAKQPAKSQPVAIGFAAVAGSTPVACGTPITGLGTTARAAQLTDLRFFVSDVRLLRKDGRAVTLRLRADSPWRVTRGKAAVTLIDLENGRGGCAEAGTKGTNAFVRGTVPAGDYIGARWSVGVPFALNHTDATTAPAPLNSAAMAWSWQVGRKFTKIELSDPGTDAAAAWAARTFFVHLGSTGCEGNPATGETVSCAASNRAAITLRRFDPARQRVAVDLKAMLAGVDATQNGGGAPGCMGGPTDPECGPIFNAFGLRAPTGGGMDMGDGGMGDGGMEMGGGMPMSASASAAAKQTVFRAIER
jgi:uncharacterized repeat protein (TIGR04052 family)